MNAKCINSNEKYSSGNNSRRITMWDKKGVPVSEESVE